MFHQNVLIIQEGSPYHDDLLSDQLLNIGYRQDQLVMSLTEKHAKNDITKYEVILINAKGIKPVSSRIRKLNSDFPDIPLIVITDSALPKQVPAGADDWLLTSWIQPLLLKKTIQLAIERKKNLYRNVKAETALKKKARDIEDILKSITDGFFTLNRDWEFTYVNKEFERIMQKTRTRLIGKNIWKVFPKARHSNFYSQYQKAMNENVAVHFEEFASSVSRWVSINAYPTDAGLTVYLIDNTDQKNYQQKIESQNKQLKEIAWVQAHQIRGPVSNLMALVELFNTTHPDDPDNLELLVRIKHTSMQMDESIKEIVQLTRKLES